MITPPYLKPGDLIAITSTARKISREELQPAIDILESWGLYVLIAPHLFEEYNQLAGNDQQRASDFQVLLDEENVKAILCARGGYGTVRIIDQLNFTKFKESPKWIIGYSDITVLHSHVNKNLLVETLHAIMPVNFKKQDENTLKSIEALRSNLFGEHPAYKINYHPFNRTGLARGQITGGNLSMLYSLIGSDSDIDTHGKVLFIEDIDEYLYHIDRMMIALKRAGKLSDLSGLIVGHFTDMRDNEIPFGKNAYEIIKDVVAEFNYPVAFGLPVGHESENLPLIMGREVQLDVNQELTTLVFMSPMPRKGLRRLKNILKPAIFIIAAFIVLYILYSIMLGQLT